MPIKLHYFDARGAAEPIRLLFAYANAPYEDVRYKLQGDDNWAKLKPETPFGQMPCLENTDLNVKLAQTSTIMRVMGNKHGLAGAEDNKIERAHIDMYATGVIEDWRPKVMPAMMAMFQGKSDDEKKAAVKEAMEKLKPNFEQYQKRLCDNGTGFLVGSKLSYADIILFNMLCNINDMDGTVLNSYPKLKEFKEKVAGLPGIKEWIEKRPKTNF